MQTMIFETHTLTPPLDRYIESVFHFKGFMPDHSIERVVPTGHVFIIFELDGYPRHTYHNESLEPQATFTKAWISGAHQNHIVISAHESSEMFVIQFKPFGAYPFLHQPIQNLSDQVLPVEQVVGHELLDLRERILPLASSAEKFELANTWLNKRFDSQNTPPQELLELLQQLQSEPTLKYKEIVGSYSNTQKHMIDQFKKYIGLSPKTYQRIVRFNDILQRIQQQDHITWSEIAYQCGFSDQSHFIKEFRHFSGFNPKEFIDLSHNLDEPNFFPLDRDKHNDG